MILSVMVVDDRLHRSKYLPWTKKWKT